MNKQTYMNLHKHRNFGNFDKKKQDCIEKLRNDRRTRRTCNFNLNRNISTIDDFQDKAGAKENCQRPVPVLKNVTDRKLQLQNYISQREEIKKALKAKEKPPFKVGIPHHGASPILREMNPNTVKITKRTCEPPPKMVVSNLRVTRGAAKAGQMKPPTNVNVFKKQKKGLGASSPVHSFPFPEKKSVFKFNVHSGLSSKKLTDPLTPTVLKRSTQKRRSPLLRQMGSKSAVKETRNDSATSTESFDTLATPLPLIEDKEVRCSKRLKKQIPLSNSPSRTIFTTPIPQDEALDVSPQLTHDVEFQRKRLDEETCRLLALADQWETTALEKNMPQPIVDEIDSVVGNTRLLTRDKFNQFRGLVDQYEANDSKHRVTSEDINGFWEMMYLQVESLNKKYTVLDKLKGNNWMPSEEPPTKKKKGQSVQTRPKVIVSSSLRSMIQSKRAKQLEAPANQDSEIRAPESGKKTHVLSVLSQRRRTQHNSLSPYISMRLSGVGRSAGTPVDTTKSVDLNTTPKLMLKTEVKTEHNPAGKKVLFNVNPDENCNTKDYGVKSSIINIKQEVEDACETLGVENTPTAETCTNLRRSIRIKACSSTPYKDKICSSCQSPQCKDSEHKVHLNNDTHSGAIRRSTRLARRVNFNSNTEEKTSMKRTATPFRKSDTEEKTSMKRPATPFRKSGGVHNPDLAESPEFLQ